MKRLKSISYDLLIGFRDDLSILLVGKALCGTGISTSGEIKTGDSDCIDEGTKGTIDCNKGDERRSETAKING